MRVAASGQETSAWTKTWKRINGLSFCSRGEGEVAELYVKKAMARFSKRHTTTGRSVSHMARDMARKVIILAENEEAIGREGAVAYHRPRSRCALL